MTSAFAKLLNEKWTTAAEVAAIVLLFYLYAGFAAPDVNEAHYLGKAKHYWNPQWCSGDLFLESADAHVGFYWGFGWLTVWLSLPAVAWIGRVLAWVWLAWTLQQMVRLVMQRSWYGPLAAGLFLCFSHHCHLAGEWVVGGCEGKSFAYALVFTGLLGAMQGRWNMAWIAWGLGTTMHALVGGWALLAGMLVWWREGPQRRPWRQMLLGLIVGVVLALPGVVAGLSLDFDVSPEIASKAHQIQVFQRLPHHLNISHFRTDRKIFFAIMIVIWLLTWRFTPRSGVARQLHHFAIGAMILWVIGIIIHWITIDNREIAAVWLRFYWYRLADAAVPLATAVGLTVWAAPTSKNHQPMKWRLLVVIVITGFLLGHSHWERRSDSRPGSARQAWRFPVNRLDHALRKHHDWQRVCRWIAVSTNADELFLTPYNNQTFKWYAGRAELVARKDCPQDAAGIVEWLKRLHEHKVSTHNWPPASQKLENLMLIAKKYGCGYVLIDNFRTSPFPESNLVYPLGLENNRSFSVVAVPQEPLTDKMDETQ